MRNNAGSESWRFGVKTIEEPHYNSITQEDRGDVVCTKLVKS